MKVLVLRGISGAGKSTWIASNAPNATVVSADHYFLQSDGSYHFDGTKIHLAHKVCYREFIAALERRDDLIVVDNGNITVWELSPYVMPAQSFGYDVEILTFLCDPEIAIKRKSWVAPEDVRMAAKRLDEETGKLPAFMQALHHMIQNDIS